MLPCFTTTAASPLCSVQTIPPCLQQPSDSNPTHHRPNTPQSKHRPAAAGAGGLSEGVSGSGLGRRQASLQELRTAWQQLQGLERRQVEEDSQMNSARLPPLVIPNSQSPSKPAPALPHPATHQNNIRKPQGRGFLPAVNNVSTQTEQRARGKSKSCDIM